MKKVALLSLMLIILFRVSAQTGEDRGYSTITRESIEGKLEFLASDWMEGRATGTRGIYLASDYIASMFKLYGIQPYGDEQMVYPAREEISQGKRPESRRSYFQNISLLEYEPGKMQEFSVTTQNGPGETSTNFTFKVDFNVQTGTTPLSGKAPVFFAGYGLSEQDYDEYKKKDIKGKVVVILQGFPGHRDSTSQAFKKFGPGVSQRQRATPERNKVRLAEDLGAIAVVLVNLQADPASGWAENSPYPVKGSYYESDTKLPSYYDKRMALPGDTLRRNIPVFTVTNRAAHHILQGIDLNSLESRAAETQTPMSQDIPAKTISWNTTVESRIVKCRNVLGYIEGKNKNEFIVVGAHYDHLGKHAGWIWNGADDNASGTVGVMSLAGAFAASGEKPEKSIIFAAWTAEETGLWGSRYFVSNFPDTKKLIYNLNFDMLSRNDNKDLKGNQLTAIYTDFSPGIKDLTGKHVSDYNLDLDVIYRASGSSSGGSDHAPFAQAGIPATFFFAGMHPDYHQPSDELSKINWSKMLNIIKLGYLNIKNLANSDEYLRNKR
jgi:Zn-dependent M28 family amino/carboxypeptidase